MMMRTDIKMLLGAYVCGETAHSSDAMQLCAVKIDLETGSLLYLDNRIPIEWTFDII